jgi:hypothetical protein
MLPLKYSTLNVSGEIRLLELLAAKFEDPITFDIFHAHLVAPKKDPDNNELELPNIKKPLPPRWTVRRMLEGESLYHFADPDEKTHRTSWTHPISGVDFSDSQVGPDEDSDIGIPKI